MTEAEIANEVCKIMDETQSNLTTKEIYDCLCREGKLPKSWGIFDLDDFLRDWFGSKRVWFNLTNDIGDKSK